MDAQIYAVPYAPSWGPAGTRGAQDSLDAGNYKAQQHTSPHG